VGSGAIDGEDAWSDIDLALRLADGLEPDDVAAKWTTRIYQNAGAVDHLDRWSDSTLFRVFLLSSSLQVDLSFWTADSFAATGASFRLLFGESNEPPPARSLAPGGLDHGVRDQAITLACLRHELPTHHGRGVDDLPAALRQTLAETLVRELDRHELRRAFAASIAALLDEAQQVDPDREQRLRKTVRELAHTVT
jgi:hypothetical protein